MEAYLILHIHPITQYKQTADSNEQEMDNKFALHNTKSNKLIPFSVRRKSYYNTYKTNKA